MSDYDKGVVKEVCSRLNLETQEEFNGKDSIEDALSIDNHLAQYLKQINDIDMLDASKQLELLTRYHETGNKEYRNAVVSSNLRFVVYKCKRYFINKQWCDPMDIIAVGNEALILAAEQFDCGHGNGFLAYAGKTIEDRVRTFIFNEDSTMPMSKESYRLKYKINQIYKEYEENKLRKPSYEQVANILVANKIASATYVTEALVRIIVEYNKPKSLNEYIAEGSNNIEIGDTMVDSEASFEIDAENKLLIGNMLGCLNDRELQIIQLRYNKELSFADIGKIFNVNRATIKQAEVRALKKMRAACLEERC